MRQDFLGFILEEAAKRDMQVFVGLYISNLTWNDGDYQFEVEQNKSYHIEMDYKLHAKDGIYDVFGLRIIIV